MVELEKPSCKLIIVVSVWGHATDPLIFCHLSLIAVRRMSTNNAD